MVQDHLHYLDGTDFNLSFFSEVLFDDIEWLGQVLGIEISPGNDRIRVL